ncbi:MAG: hypothetical protein DI535_08910 [Citrobacter freundii]|nr:MAG: hypothetical protein DI535_08910 [Citrobacter freundii]
MKNNFFSYWKLLRYAVCLLVALSGFALIFIKEDPARGRVLLMIATIGVFGTVLYDMLDKHLRGKR